MRRFVAALVAVLALAGAAVAEPPPEPDDYRQADYRAPTPATLQGARVLNAGEAEALWRNRAAAFVDVMPQAPRPPNLPAGTVWRDKPRISIPGSLWLPDTGYGTLAATTEDYFRRGLEAATGGDRDKLLVIFCQRDCWMSWNAGRRALALGYRSVAWYPDGTDGWSEAGLPLEPATPLPRPE
jgi:PQQ-dependent catabolism-associated CXXCW motif protein